MTKARTPVEFISWMECKLYELSLHKAAKAFSLSGDPLVRKFFDELFPLYRFVAHEYVGRDDVIIQPNLGNENFDARVTVEDSPVRRDVFIEITYAKDGYDLSLRMEVLAKEGVVPVTGPVTVTGPKGSPDRRVSATLLAVDISETLDIHLALVEERLRNKSDMQYGNKHILVVAVDDYALYDETYWPRLTGLVHTLLPTLNLNFARVVFVGIAGGLFKSFMKLPGGTWSESLL